MQLFNIDMINNTIKTAKYKLSLHKSQGLKSDLSIFEVAQLMDAVKKGEQMNQRDTTNFFFSVN